MEVTVLFGYVRPVSAELKVKEYELYRAIYCGLCESLGHNATCASRLSLSYDFVFLALVRMALQKEVGKIEQHRCLAHPTKKRAVVTKSEQLDYCARLSAVLTYYKLRDDIADSRGAKRIGAKMLVPAGARMRKKAKLDKEAEEYIKERLEALSKLEADGCASIDQAAEPFGELMAYVCSCGFDTDSASYKIACEIGRSMGRFIYIADAVDDLEDDVKTGAYNPFRMMYEDAQAGLSRDIEAIRFTMTMELTRVEAAVGLIDFEGVFEYGEIIKNIIYLGLVECRDRVLGKYTLENKPTDDMENTNK